MRLRYTRLARQAIDDILSHIAAHSPQGADRVRARILEAADLIEWHPHAGQATDRTDTRRLVLTPFPYVMFYRVAGDDVTVQRVRHAARRT